MTMIIDGWKRVITTRAFNNFKMWAREILDKDINEEYLVNLTYCEDEIKASCQQVVESRSKRTTSMSA